MNDRHTFKHLKKERLIEVSFVVIIYRLGSTHTVTNYLYTFKH
jgi:hypothetical protein